MTGARIETESRVKSKEKITSHVTDQRTPLESPESKSGTKQGQKLEQESQSFLPGEGKIVITINEMGRSSRTIQKRFIRPPGSP